jgi:peptide chain release factor 2
MMLLRMYLRYFERMGFSSQELDRTDGEEAGIRSLNLLVKGPYAYGYLSCELGVHRLVRISPFDSQHRRHTSFASVDVLPELAEVNIEIRDEDIELSFDRASGPGGQHVNKTSSAVRIVHKATGIIVRCQNERSQHKNRSLAMKMLQAKLYRLEEQKRDAQLAKLYGEKGQIAWGNQIRSYFLQPYQLVKDHRTGHEQSNPLVVLDGKIDEFVAAYLRQRV